MSDPNFIVVRRDFARLAYWFLFFPKDESTLTDRTLSEKFYAMQDVPGETSIPLNSEEVTRVRLWFDYVSDVVLDESDEDYAERLDEWLVRFS